MKTTGRPRREMAGLCGAAAVRAWHRDQPVGNRAATSSSCQACAIRSPSTRSASRRGGDRSGAGRGAFRAISGLDPQFVLKRLQASLNPPPGVTLSVDGDRIVAQGSASSPWIARARRAGNLLPAGAPVFDVSAVRNVSEGALGKLRDAIQARSIRFDNNVMLPAAGQEEILDQLAAELNRAREIVFEPERHQ